MGCGTGLGRGKKIVLATALRNISRNNEILHNRATSLRHVFLLFNYSNHTIRINIFLQIESFPSATNITQLRCWFEFFAIIYSTNI